jgi:N-acetylglucosaminyl-diphospho-decaprenol L-rhamnosyltransferase
MDVKLSIIIVNYKTRALTLECLRSVYSENKREDFEVILVDNNSDDGSVEAFGEQFPNIKLIPLAENIGFACANNLAAKHACGEYLLLLNPDTVVLDNAIFRLVEFGEATPNAGIWGGRTLFGDHSLNPTSCWRAQSLWSVFCALAGLRALFPDSGLFHSEGYGGWRRDTVRDVDVVTGCFLMIRRTLWDRLEGFDPVFFMYGEDADLCLRAKALGFCPTTTPNAAIVHYAGASEWIPARKHTQMLAAKLTLIKRHWAPPKRWAGLFLLRLYPYSRAIGYALLSVLRGSSKAKQELEIWMTVLKQKKQWTSGFIS